MEEVFFLWGEHGDRLSSDMTARCPLPGTGGAVVLVVLGLDSGRITVGASKAVSTATNLARTT